MKNSNIIMAGSIERDQIIDQYKIQNLAGQDQFREYYSAYEIETGKHVTLTVTIPVVNLLKRKRPISGKSSGL